MSWAVSQTHGAASCMTRNGVTGVSYRTCVAVIRTSSSFPRLPRAIRSLQRVSAFVRCETNGTQLPLRVSRALDAWLLWESSLRFSGCAGRPVLLLSFTTVYEILGLTLHGRYQNPCPIPLLVSL